MLIGIGIDIVDNERMRRNMKNMRFLKRVFTAGELSYFRAKANAYQSVAASFAAKEAFFKALGTGILSAGLAVRDIGIAREKGGRPYIEASERVLKYIKRTFGASSVRIHISIAHEKAYSVAVAVIESATRR
ncbi:MAG: holo-ACP synthase [Spirochaetota bacterium]